MVLFCEKARSQNKSGGAACLVCCGKHQSPLRAAGCLDSSIRRFCLAEDSFQFMNHKAVYSTDSPIHASPRILEDTVLFSTLEPDCAFYRWNISSGELAWRYAAPRLDSADPNAARCGLRSSARVSSTPGGSHRIHVATDNNTFIELDASDGSAAWTQTEATKTCIDSGKPRPCEVYSTALVWQWPDRPDSGGIRIQGSEDGQVRGFNVDTGQLAWNKTIGEQVNGSPVVNPVNKSQIVIAADDGFMYCLSAATGHECGRLATCGQMDTMPSVDNVSNTLFYTCFYAAEPNAGYNHPRGWVAAVELSTFTHKWIRNGTGGIPLFSSAHKAVFVGYMNGSIGSLNASTGTLLWLNEDIPSRTEFFGTFVLDRQRDLLYGVNLHSRVVAISPFTGRLVAVADISALGKPVANNLGPALSSDGEILFVGTYGGNLVALPLP